MTTESVKMADDTDIPPLEDMTDVLRQAEAIREHRQNTNHHTTVTSDQKQSFKDPKARAKVTKKVVQNGVKKSPEELPDSCKPKETQAVHPPTSSSASNSSSSSSSSITTPTTSTSTSSSKNQGLFGGMRKGFLSGGPAKTSCPKPVSTTSSSPSPSPSGASATAKQSTGSPGNKPVGETGTRIPAVPQQKEDIPYIKPSGKTESGLTLDEVQQAMSEAKGLLDNQDWITDDLLSKIEKNDMLLKRFSDPHFMDALQEFQTNPQAAMAKYKGNTEVEKFLLEFCGLLGDHFTKMGSDSEKSPASGNKTSELPKSSQISTKHMSAPTKTPAGPKIVELVPEEASSTTLENAGSKVKSGKASSADAFVGSGDVIRSSQKSQKSSDIRIHNGKNGADIQEMPKTEDEAVKQVLSDPKVMEILMDRDVMQLIQTLREDPAKGQRLVDKAGDDLKKKINILVSKGLLQFQMH